jgi:cytochrome c-type biogenesis protein
MDPHAHAAWVVAVLAGVLSFISPCVLPLIPGYLSMISGLSVEQLEERRSGQMLRVVLACALFSLGLCIAFVPVGLAAGAVGRWLGPHRGVLNIVLGALVVVFGLFIMNVIKLPFLYKDRRFRLSRGATGLWAAPLLGMAFGFGWTPCFGPFVGALITLAKDAPPLQAGLLFLVYAISLGACFTLAGLLFHWAVHALSFFQRHYRAVELVSGGLLVVLGLLMMSGRWDWFAGKLMGLVPGG